jgi:tetratricopeptide (TPR) repeat protein
LRVKDAIEVLNKAVEDPEVLPEDKTTKMAIAVLVMEDLFDVVLKDGTTEDADPLKATIADYYQKIIDSDPALKASRQLIQVQFLVRQGERRRAIDLVNQYWGDAPVETLITACGALLNVDDNLKNAEKLGLSPQSTEADKEKRKAQLMAEVGEVEAVVQQALLKYQTELATLEGPENATKKKMKEAEVISLMSLLANQYVNTKRYSEAVGTYADILSRQPENVIALNNRAMIMAGGSEKLDEALLQINDALNIIGPLPMIVDSQAMVLLAAGKTQEALEAANRVMLEKPDRLDPASDKQLAKQWGGYYFHLALISDANGDAAGAASAMREADKLGFKEADLFDLELPAWKKLAAKLGM